MAHRLSDSNPRLASLAGFLATVAFAAGDAASPWKNGLPATSVATFLLDLPLAAYFFCVAFLPGPTGRALSFRARFDPERAGHVAAGALVAFALTLTVSRPVAAVIGRIEGATVALPGTGPEILLGTGVLALLTIGSTILWLQAVEGARTGTEVLKRLSVPGFRPRRAGTVGLLVGAASVIVGTLFVLGWNLVEAAFGRPPSDDAVARGLAQALGLGGIVVAAGLSAVHEETFFRGFLLPRLGLGLQAGLFAVGHAGYGTAAQVLVPLLLGLAWGWMFLRTRSLVAPVVAHAVFNLAGFLLAWWFSG